jgi:hypothetical protein
MSARARAVSPATATGAGASEILSRLSVGLQRPASRRRDDPLMQWPFARRARRLPDGTQEARIVVDRGYTPSRIDLEADVPAVLRFARREDDPCTELLVSELWPSEHRLAAHGETLIRFTPQRPGRYAFTCGMGMYSGELVVHERRTN